MRGMLGVEPQAWLRRLSVALAFSLVGGIGAGCYGQDQKIVSEATARKAFEQQLAKGLEGEPFVIVSFKKTNGAAVDAFGSQGYEVFYEATVNFPQGVRKRCWHPDNFAGLACGGIGGPPLWPPTHEPGVQKLKGELDFLKTEKGWMVQ